MTRTTTIAYRDNRLAHVEEQSDSCYNMASCTSPEELGVFIARSLARNPVDSLLASSCSVDLALTYRALTKNTSSAPLANVDPIAFAEQLQDVSQVASHAMANHLTILRLSEIVLTSDIEWYTRATEHGVAAQKKTQQAHDEWRAAFKVKYGFDVIDALDYFAGKGYKKEQALPHILRGLVEIRGRDLNLFKNRSKTLKNFEDTSILAHQKFDYWVLDTA